MVVFTVCLRISSNEYPCDSFIPSEFLTVASLSIDPETSNKHIISVGTGLFEVGGINFIWIKSSFYVT